jgi:alkanesulfonate monooxygenase SsuD/methylene tetrahydromethanopterin reductase-like flavin-dependent oxidoreductase (luciferase family)
MQVGVVFPQTELGGCGPAELRQYAVTVESLGYRHLLAHDYVVGADPARHSGWTHKFTADTTFRDPFVLFGYLAVVTPELVTGVLVLPQPQTALVAKEATEVEVALLRRLWVEDSVSFAGRFERVAAAAIAPRPRMRPIPVSMGAQSAPGYCRAGCIADGEVHPHHRRWAVDTERPSSPAIPVSVFLCANPCEIASRSPSDNGNAGRGRGRARPRAAGLRQPVMPCRT